jgi:hypothetical protein
MLSAIQRDAVNADEYPRRYTSTGILECVWIFERPLGETLLGMLDAASDGQATALALPDERLRQATYLRLVLRRRHDCRSL